MIFYDANVIYEAMRLAIKSGDRNRYVTQLYQVNHLLYTAMLQESLCNGTYKPAPGNKFVLSERGKTRFVTNNAMVDKVVNHMICDEILTPALQRFLIHDNGASQKGKGVSFHRERFEKHLRDYFKQHGDNNGYILLGDFSGYYANIRHDICSKVLAHFLRRSNFDPEDLRVAWKILTGIFDTFRVDVSRFSDEEIRAMYTTKVDAINHGGFASILQRAVIDCGQSVIVDGKFGPKTFSALKACEPVKLAKAIYQQRKKYYEKIVARNPSQKVFLKGWMRRADEMAREAGVT